jgi:hypothetical protein
MKLFLRRNAPLFYVLGAMLALYIPWLNRGYLNFEWGTALAGRGLSSSENFYYLQAYKDSGHANPLGYPFLISLMHRVFGFKEAFWYSRIPALACALILLIWGFRELRRRDHFSVVTFYSWAALLILNPMIFAFSTSATTDVPAAALLLLSVTFLSSYFSNQKTKFVVFAALAMGFSSCVKYITPYFAFMVFFIFYGIYLKNIASKTKLVRDLFIFGVVAVGVLLIEVLWKWRNTGVLFSARNEEMAPDFLNLTVWGHTLGKYLAFIGLCCGLLPVANALGILMKSSRRRLLAMLSVFSLAAGWLFGGQLSKGELDFGGGFPFGEIIGRALQAFGFFGATVLFLICYRHFKFGDVVSRGLLVGLVPYLVLLSASRPTQRYLTYAIPVALLVLVEALMNLPKKVKYFALGSTALGFAAVSLLGMSYLTSQGNASEDMAVWVEENNLISQTSAGAIWPHAGQHFWGVKTTEIRYEIIAVTPATESQVQEQILHREPMKVLGKVTRVYLLREIVADP